MLGRFGRAASAGGWLKREEAIMGTAIASSCGATTRAAGEAAIDAVMAEMHRIDRAMSPHKADSELSRINRDAAPRPVPLSAEMARLLVRAHEFAELSGGAFDITYAGRRPALRLPRRASRPSEAETLAARAPPSAGATCSSTPGRAPCASRARACASTSAASPRAMRSTTRRAILRRRGIAPRDGERRRRQPRDRRPRAAGPWTIGVRDPRRAGEVVAVLPLEDVSISTSGDYERFFDATACASIT